MILSGDCFNLAEGTRGSLITMKAPGALSRCYLRQIMEWQVWQAVSHAHFVCITSTLSTTWSNPVGSDFYPFSWYCLLALGDMQH